MAKRKWREGDPLEGGSWLEDEGVMSLVRGAQGHSELTVPVSAFLKLLDRASTGDGPAQTFLHHATYRGYAGPDCATLQCSFLVEVGEQHWSKVSLLSGALAVTYALVQRVGGGPGGDHDAPSSNAVVVWGSREAALVAAAPGRYEVTMGVQVAYSSRHNRSIALPVPRAVENEVVFWVPMEDAQVKITPQTTVTAFPERGRAGLVSSIGPDAEVLDPFDLSETMGTLASAKFACTNNLTVQWTHKLVETAAKDDEKTPKMEEEREVVTVEQWTLHSIGEGVLQAVVELQYSIVHGTRSILEINLDKHFRVLHVEGGSQLKRWDILEGPKTQEAPSAPSEAAAVPAPGDQGAGALGAPRDAAEGSELGSRRSSKSSMGSRRTGKALRVFLDYGVEGTYKLTIIGEVDLESDSCRVQLPSFCCRHVNREKGFIGVEANTNVEIQEFHQERVARVAISELPQRMRSRAVNPLLQGYKFVVPSTTVVLDVKKHEDIGVLIAIIDDAWVDVTVAEGWILQRMVFNVRNTQKQYCRISLPDKSCEIWSSVVSGRAVKPAGDDEGRIMIPLEKKSAAGGKTQKAFRVEIVFVQPIEKMGVRGHMGLRLARVDIPISHLFVSVFLPQPFEYGEFEGDLKEVGTLSKYLDESSLGDVQREIMPMNYPQQQQQVAPPQVSLSNVMLDNNPPRPTAAEQTKTSFSHKGIVPVKIAALKVGKGFYFERLLVNNEFFQLRVEYKEIPKKHKRRAKPWCFVL